MLRIPFLIPFLALVFAGLAAVAAEPAGGGIAMHGAPKYPPDFAHLDYADPDAPKGGTITEGVVGSFDNLNRFALTGRAAAGLHLLHDTLMRRVWDEPFTHYPLIAQRAEMPEDRRWIRFTLDPRARFHDGSPITVADALWSFEALRTQARPNFRNAYNQVETAEQTGPRSFTFTLKPTASREIPMILAMMPVLPRKDWQGRDLGAARLDPPLGSGPYRIAEAEPGRRVVYQRVADYWAADLPVNRGHYNADRLIYDYYRDESIALEAFKAGAFDIRREGDPIRWSQNYDFPAIRDGSVIKAEIAHGRPQPMRGIIFNLRRPPFETFEVRYALALAFDFETLNRTLFAGRFRRIDSIFPNAALAHDGVPSAAELTLLEPWRDLLPASVFAGPHLPPKTDGSGPRGHRANLRMAADLLDQAGLPVVGGVRRDSEGVPLSLELLLADPSDQRLALGYAQALERLGIALRVKVADAAQYRERLNRFDFDLTIHHWASSLSPGIEQTYYWGCDAGRAEGGRNTAGICNPAIDALAEAVASAATRAELETAASALDRAVMAGHYFIPLGYVESDWIAHDSGLRRAPEVPLYGVVLESWWRDVAP